MIIKTLNRTEQFHKIVAFTHKYVYNAWIWENTIHFYMLSNDGKSDVLYHFTARTENGIEDIINTVNFPGDTHDVMTILETLFYYE